ncbi:nitroreductase family protein [candidate division WOR-3 bacterium]|nr:nitroreductase family protein [candidate division WOR-3 bacterium]
MDAFEAINTRRSIRAFQDREVPLDAIRKILEAGMKAPSGGNRQPWRFVVVTDKKKIKHFDPYGRQPWVENAPAVIVACADPHDTWERYDEDERCYILDTSAAIQNMLLAIHASGLGGVWILTFSKREVRKQLAIPLHWEIVSIIPFGYYKEDGTVKFRDKLTSNSETRPRKPLSDVSFLNDARTPFKA